MQEIKVYMCLYRSMNIQSLAKSRDASIYIGPYDIMTVPGTKVDYSLLSVLMIFRERLHAWAEIL